MFEPLQHLFAAKADAVVEQLKEIRSHLTQVVSNTESEINFIRIGEYSNQVTVAAAETTAEIKLFPRKGRMWRLTVLSVTGKAAGEVNVYLGAVSPQDLVDVFTAAPFAGGRRYYVPAESALIFVFSKQEAGQVCTANIQVEEYEHSAKIEAKTGTSNESVSPVLRSANEEPDPFGGLRPKQLQ